MTLRFLCPARVHISAYSTRKWWPLYFPAHRDDDLFPAVGEHHHIAWNRFTPEQRGKIALLCLPYHYKLRQPEQYLPAIVAYPRYITEINERRRTPIRSGPVDLTLMRYTVANIMQRKEAAHAQHTSL